MGKLTSGGTDLAIEVLSGTFTATGQSASRSFFGTYNVSLTGTFVGTINIDRSFDGGTTWAPISGTTLGTTATFTAPTTFTGEEIEAGNLYRLNCTAYTSGTITYRMSR